MAGGTRGRNVTAPGTRTGRDGKQYRAAPLTPEQRKQARWLAHILVHRDRLSIRAAQARMAQDGIRRSTGAIAADLRDFTCPACADQDN